MPGSANTALSYAAGPMDGQYAEPYTSTIIELLEERLGDVEGPVVLDAGPVCGENISYLASRVKRLHVCDLFLRLVRDRAKGLEDHKLWRHLDYPPQSLDAIIIWDLVDRLDDTQAQTLVKLIGRLLRPGGHLVLFALEEQMSSMPVNTFVLGEDYLVSMRPQSHLEMELQVRQNREVLAMFTSFSCIRSFLYRNGLREFLFQLTA